MSMANLSGETSNSQNNIYLLYNENIYQELKHSIKDAACKSHPTGENPVIKLMHKS